MQYNTIEKLTMRKIINSFASGEVYDFVLFFMWFDKPVCILIYKSTLWWEWVRDLKKNLYFIDIIYN